MAIAGLGTDIIEIARLNKSPEPAMACIARPLKEVHGAPINRIMHFYVPQKSA